MFKNNNTNMEIDSSDIASKKRFQNPIDWAENNRIMSDGDSPWPWRFSYKLLPFMKEIAECFSEDSPVREVVLKRARKL